MTTVVSPVCCKMCFPTNSNHLISFPLSCYLPCIYISAIFHYCNLFVPPLSCQCLPSPTDFLSLEFV